MIRFRRAENAASSRASSADCRSAPLPPNFQAALNAAIVERQFQERRRQPRTATNPSYARTGRGDSIEWIRARGGSFNVAPPAPAVQIALPPPSMKEMELGEWFSPENKPLFKHHPPRSPRTFDPDL